MLFLFVHSLAVIHSHSHKCLKEIFSFVLAQGKCSLTVHRGGSHILVEGWVGWVFGMGISRVPLLSSVPLMSLDSHMGTIRSTHRCVFCLPRSLSSVLSLLK